MVVGSKNRIGKRFGDKLGSEKNVSQKEKVELKKLKMSVATMSNSPNDNEENLNKASSDSDGPPSKEGNDLPEGMVSNLEEKLNEEGSESKNKVETSQRENTGSKGLTHASGGALMRPIMLAINDLARHSSTNLQELWELEIWVHRAKKLEEEHPFHQKLSSVRLMKTAQINSLPLDIAMVAKILILTSSTNQLKNCKEYLNSAMEQQDREAKASYAGKPTLTKMNPFTLRVDPIQQQSKRATGGK